MAEAQERSLMEVLFGAVAGEPVRADADLAATVSAWFRSSRARALDRTGPGKAKPGQQRGAQPPRR
jgi:hypothetical protein